MSDPELPRGPAVPLWPLPSKAAALLRAPAAVAATPLLASVGGLAAGGAAGIAGTEGGDGAKNPTLYSINSVEAILKESPNHSG